MIIEIGKFYKTDSGSKIKIIYIHDKGTHPVIGLFNPDNENIVAVIYTLNGTNLGNDNLNLVSEWQEPLDFDWDCLPKWADKCISMNVKGIFRCYDKIPAIEIYLGIWDPLSYSHVIPIDFCPKNFTGNWKDSLFKNPKYED